MARCEKGYLCHVCGQSNPLEKLLYRPRGRKEGVEEDQPHWVRNPQSRGLRPVTGAAVGAGRRSSPAECDSRWRRVVVANRSRPGSESATSFRAAESVRAPYAKVASFTVERKLPGGFYLTSSVMHRAGHRAHIDQPVQPSPPGSA